MKTEPQPGHDWFDPALRNFTAERLARYSHFVLSLKIILPVFAAILLLVLMIVPNVTAPPMPERQIVMPDTTLQNPVYTSQDQQSRPYQATADQAQQKAAAPGITNLTAPKAQIDLGNGETLNGAAATGQYNQKTGKLNLQGGLTLQHSNGAAFHTDSAEMDVNSKNVTGNAPVVLDGPFGQVRGTSFEARDGGKTVIFKGGSATLKLGGSKTENSTSQGNKTNP
jgi:LPS export ABC transporter protein LptC